MRAKIIHNPYKQDEFTLNSLDQTNYLHRIKFFVNFTKEKEKHISFFSQQFLYFEYFDIKIPAYDFRQFTFRVERPRSFFLNIMRETVGTKIGEYKLFSLQII